VVLHKLKRLFPQRGNLLFNLITTILKGQESKTDSLPLRMGPKDCPETSERNWHYPKRAKLSSTSWRKPETLLVKFLIQVRTMLAWVSLAKWATAHNQFPQHTSRRKGMVTQSLSIWNYFLSIFVHRFRLRNDNTTLHKLFVQLLR